MVWLQYRHVVACRDGFYGAHSWWPIPLGIRVLSTKPAKAIELLCWMDVDLVLASWYCVRTLPRGHTHSSIGDRHVPRLQPHELAGNVDGHCCDDPRLGFEHLGNEIYAYVSERHVAGPCSRILDDHHCLLGSVTKSISRGDFYSVYQWWWLEFYGTYIDGRSAVGHLRMYLYVLEYLRI
jgi:hypothetical protein